MGNYLNYIIGSNVVLLDNVQSSINTPMCLAATGIKLDRGVNPFKYLP